MSFRRTFYFFSPCFVNVILEIKKHIYEKEERQTKSIPQNRLNHLLEIYQQRAEQTNGTEINANKKNTLNNPIEKKVKFRTILTIIQKTSKAMYIHHAKNTT